MSKEKISIRFFDDREVRAVWDEQDDKWWFSVLDIIAVLTTRMTTLKLEIIGSVLKPN